MRPSWGHIALVFASVTLTLVGAEWVLRLAGVGYYSLHDQVLFYTFPAFVGDAQTGVRYAPNTSIREVAVYGDQIDYDVVQHSNNLGFYDDIDYQRAPEPVRDIVVIGDSFTAGSGGFAWVAGLRPGLAPGSAIYNLGVGSASVHHFLPLLSSFARDIPFDEVNIVVISNDFFRPFWLPVQKQDALWFCPGFNQPYDCSSMRRPLIHRLDSEDSHRKLLEKAAAIYANSRQSGSDKPAYLRRLNLYTVFCDALSDYLPRQTNVAICPHLKVHYYPSYVKDQIYRDSVERIKALPGKFPGVKFRVLHMPEKGEVVLGEYGLDIAADIADANIEYVSLLRECAWDRRDFYKHDGHPNMSGYAKLRDCVGRII